jgi:DmsE family decaheme c-type cytochrome
MSILFSLLCLGGVIATVHLLPCLADCAAGDGIPKDHMRAMRAEMARIHDGKVDAATLRRIQDQVAAMHRNAARETTLAGGAWSNTGLTNKISSYLRVPGRPHGLVAVAWTDPGWVRTAENLARSPAVPARSGPASFPEGRSYVGRQTCMGCHQQEATNWAHTIHAKVFNFNPRDAIQAQGCEACHGPGSDHIKNPSDFTTIISFSHKSVTPVARQNAQCLSCHQGGNRIFWHSSIHDTNNVGCSDCHNPMTNFSARGMTARESVNETCFQCHKTQRADFAKRSHMPLLEGKLTCVDCHNPHGSTTSPLLKADSVNELCYSCHAEKRGPFLFEHAPVRESCLNCHSPHGSNFEALLNTPRPVLCQQCHSQDGHPAQLMTRGNLAMGPAPDPRLISTSCQTCHVNIHGSNSPAGARFER